MKKKCPSVKDQKKGKIVYRTIQLLMAATLFLMVAISCNKDEGTVQPSPINLEGSLEELKNYYTNDFVAAMQAFGFNLNLGNTPPNLEGSYSISPFILKASSVPGDSQIIGHAINDYLATFSNQDNDKLTIDFTGMSSGEADEGNGSFITGNNSVFAVYTKTTSQIGSTPSESAIAISGFLTPNGIEGIQVFAAMLNDHGDPENVYIENNTGRFLIDGDDFSPKESSTSKEGKKAQKSSIKWARK